jgi:hypothetical protein
MSHKEAQRRNSHKKAQKAQKVFLKNRFVFFVLFCG